MLFYQLVHLNYCNQYRLCGLSSHIVSHILEMMNFGFKLIWATCSFEERAMEQKYMKHPPQIFTNTLNVSPFGLRLPTPRSTIDRKSISSLRQKKSFFFFFFLGSQCSSQIRLLEEPLFPVASLSRV